MPYIFHKSQLAYALIAILIGYADPPPKCIVRITQSGSGYTSGAAYRIKLESETRGVLILTCAHGRDNEQGVEVHWPGDQHRSTGNVVAVDESKDLAVVRVEDYWPALTFYRLIPKETRELSRRDEVRLTGYGARGYYSRHAVVLGAIDVNYWGNKTRHLIRTEEDSRKGDSGSPVILRGWICGVTVAGMGEVKSKTNAGDAMFVGHQQIWEFLEEKDLQP